MLSEIKSLEQAATVPARNLTFLVEPEPWLRIFLRNMADIFRPAPPRVWMTARLGQYWSDALVNRPVAWGRMRQSLLGHILAALFVYWITLLWLNRPQVLPVELPRTTIRHYALSEYLPAVNTERTEPKPPARKQAQAADPEYAQQEIVSIHSDPTSLKQTIVHPNPYVLTQDVPLPNLMAWTPVPSAAPIAANRPLENLPLDVPQVAAPVQPTIQKSRLTFPVLPQPEVIEPAGGLATKHAVRAVPSAAPEVVPPASSVADTHSAPVLPVTGPVVIAPAQQPVAHNSLRISAQAPEVAQPAGEIVSRKMLTTVPDSAPPVVAPSQSAAPRNLAAMSLNRPAQAVVPPPQPVAGGGPALSAMGQLLALNARPVAPVGPVIVPQGIHRGELAAGPTGRTNATARPEIAAGDNSGSTHAGSDSAPANIFVSTPPVRIAPNNAVVAGPASIPPVRTTTPRVDVPADRFDAEVFGLRHRYSVRLSMPNLNSAIGSWIMRFARLNSEPGHEEELSAPEPLRKVDPAYPASFMHDRIEGVVILYAVIHSDGSVGEVRVLEGFEPLLDENARVALQQWLFRPGTRAGVPVDVEAVVHVPFRVRKPEF
jgi:TonB family protein